MENNEKKTEVVEEVKTEETPVQTEEKQENPVEPKSAEPPKETVKAPEPEKSWLHKKAEKVCANCADREKKKADKKAKKQAERDAKAAGGGMSTKKKIGIGVGLAVAAVGGGLVTRGMMMSGQTRGTYELGPGDVREIPNGGQQVLSDGSVIQKTEVIEPVNIDVGSDYPTE